MMQPVMVTKDATLDNLSLQDYQDMVIDLRTTLSLDKMIAVLSSQYSKPLWAKVQAGEVVPNRTMRNELRRHFKLPELPPTVADACAAASPDAAVWQVGEGVPETVIMLAGLEPVTLHVNGSVSVGDVDATMPRNGARTPLESTEGRERHIETRVRPSATPEQDLRRDALGVKWADVIEQGLAVMEAAKLPDDNTEA